MINVSPLGSVTLISDRRHFGSVMLKIDFPREIVEFSDSDWLIDSLVPLEIDSFVPTDVDSLIPLDVDTEAPDDTDSWVPLEVPVFCEVDVDSFVPLFAELFVPVLVELLVPVFCEEFVLEFDEKDVPEDVPEFVPELVDELVDVLLDELLPATTVVELKLEALFVVGSPTNAAPPFFPSVVLLLPLPVLV